MKNCPFHLKKKTKTGYSTDSSVLEALLDQTPIVAFILRYRALEKLRSTYLETLPKCIYEQTGRVHCTFNQSVAATGRLACQDPNLQNIPVKTEEGRKIREAFYAEKEYSFVAFDYSQIELRLLAHLSGDPNLIEAFLNSEDIHKKTASLIFHCPLNDVTESLRSRAKAVNFGVLYGQGSYGLSKELKISIEEAKLFIQSYFDRYRKVRDFIEQTVAFAYAEGYVKTLFGRKRPLPTIHSKNPQLKSAAERLAVNTPIQGSNADLIKNAMITIDQELKKQGLKSRMLLQIHDELLFEAPKDEVPLLSIMVRQIMENVVFLKVPLLVDVAVGKNWKEC